GATTTAEIASQEKVASVKAGERAELELGMPFTLKPVVEGMFWTGQQAQIFSELFGGSGEEYSNVTARGRNEIPQVRVLDAEGMEVAEGKMEYEYGGRFGHCGYWWNIPQDLMLTEGDFGKFTVIVTFDAGPFGGKLEGRKEIVIRKG
ncbi:MAG: hypothetical protein JXQ29_00860, partial [Planctomycetes bacterium]|nr:hypothetical protein [Planctomycetota bacterium]